MAINKKTLRICFGMTFAAFALLFYPPCFAVTPLGLPDGTEFIIEHHSASGSNLLIWLPSEAGPQVSDSEIAKALVRHGIEVWRVDVLEARFLPTAQSSMDLVPASDVAALIQYGIEKTAKQVFVAGTGRAVIPILRGVRHWQDQNRMRQHRFGGVILLSPKFFVETPDPGEAAALMPIVSVSNLPIYLIQPRQSPWFWKLPVTLPALQQSGSEIFLHTLPKVRDRFYFRPDAVDYEKQVTSHLPDFLFAGIKLLRTLPYRDRQAAKKVIEQPQVRVGKKDRSLLPYTGNPLPPKLRLPDIQDNVRDLSDFRGKVVLVNFWASWCPPCVFEMPSMQRLQDKYRQQGFAILGVNMAEDKATIANFLKTKVNVDFPILLDSDGDALKRWQVFAFPTSYVLDRQGRIRYALFGGLEWDTPEIMEKIEGLLQE